MKKCVLILGLILALVLAAPALADNPQLTMPAQVQAPNFSNLVVFGDSLSDSGNVFMFTQGAEPPPAQYWMGRWSNGPVWSENMADCMGIGVDFLLEQMIEGGQVPEGMPLFFNNAYGGAQTGDGAFNFLLQVGAWVDTGLTVPADSLVVVWIGANDFLANPAGAAEQIPIAVGNIVAGLTTLADQLGATHIAVANLPDLGATPAFNGDPTTREQGRQIALGFNAALAQGLAAFMAGHPAVTVYQIDMLALIDRVLANPVKYNFTDVTHAALFEGKTFAEGAGYLFWDGVHPTAQTHQQVAAEVYGQVVIGVPNAEYFKSGSGVPIGIVPVEGQIENVSFVNPGGTNSYNRPTNMIYGLIDITMSTNTGAVVFNVALPRALPAGYSWYKYINGNWVDFIAVHNETGGQNGAQVSADRMQVQVRIVDNGPYDTDPRVGFVRDPNGGGSPYIYPITPGGDSGNCFVKSISSEAPAALPAFLAFMALMAAAVIGLASKRR